MFETALSCRNSLHCNCVRMFIGDALSCVICPFRHRGNGAGMPVDLSACLPMWCVSRVRSALRSWCWNNRAHTVQKAARPMTRWTADWRLGHPISEHRFLWGFFPSNFHEFMLCVSKVSKWLHASESVCLRALRAGLGHFGDCHYGLLWHDANLFQNDVLIPNFSFYQSIALIIICIWMLLLEAFGNNRSYAWMRLYIYLHLQMPLDAFID